MKKTALLTVAVAGALVITSLPGISGANVSAAEEPQNLFAAPGFDGMLLEGEDQYELTPNQRCSTGSLDFDSHAVAKREANGNVYLELKYDGAKGFASIFSMMQIPGAGDYTVSVDFKKGDNWDKTDNIGFRFFSPTDCKDSKGWASAINEAETGKWFTLTETYSVSEASYPGVDSFSLWFNTMGKTDNVLMMDNVVITYNEPKDDNLFAAPGFDGMLLEGEDQYELTPNQRCSTGSLDFDSHAVAKREANGNVYLELKYDGAKGFASIFSMMKIPAAGDYTVSVDFKKGDNWDKTDNVGFRLVSSSSPLVDSKGWASAINEAEKGKWFTLTQTYSVSAAYYPGVDSFALWFNTMGNANNVLMMDNVVITYNEPESEAPVVVGEDNAVWNEESASDITFGVDLKGKELKSVTDAKTEEEFTSGYTYTAAENKITFTSAFVKDLGEGSHELKLTTDGGSVSVVITVYMKQSDIPSTTDGYELVSTMLGGDFEDYDVGLTFSDAQTAEAWGSLASYDDPGVIVDDGTGNHALRLGRKEGSTKRYSSAFCMTSPDISLGDIVTLKYAYKIVGDASKLAGKDVNTCFVGASNVPYHRVDFVGKVAKTVEGNENEKSYAVKYTDGENGYVNVEMSFIVDFAFLNATNSLRFLYDQVDGVELYFDNVELVRWVEEGSENVETPVATGSNLTFDNNNQADVTLTVDLKDYNISSIKNGSDTVNKQYYSLSENDTKLTISKDYLATLKNGKHTLTLTTLGGSCTFEITVSNHAEEPVEPPKDAGCCSSIAAYGSIGMIAVAIGAAVVVLRKRKNG